MFKILGTSSLKINQLMLVLFFLFGTFFSTAQIFTGNATLTTQAEVDAFAANNYTSIIGNLSIQDGSDITNIDNLGSITSIDGLLNIENLDGLNTMDAFHNLSSVSGTVALTNLNNLSSMTGFSNLQSIGETLSLSGLPNVSSFNGFGALNTIAEELEITVNASLQSLDNFTTLSSLFVLKVEQNDLLESISMPNLGSVQFISLSENPALLTLNSFSNVTSFIQLQIIASDALTNLDDFAAVSSPADIIILQGNTSLANIDGLSNIPSLNQGMILQDNPMLDACCGVYSLLANSSSQTQFLIQNNLTNCNNKAEIIALCEDADGDGVNLFDGDCDDTDHQNFPGNTEICDGQDNNCDGIIDEDACGVAYCNPTPSSTFYEYIRRVRIGNINNFSGDDNGYGDFTALSTDLNGGSNNTIRLRPGYNSGAYPENWVAWIDFNQNGDFEDAGEQVFAGQATGLLVGSVYVPLDAPAGETQMRIAMAYGEIPTSCGGFAEGEIEDYTVNIITTPCGDLPPAWANQDIGNPNITGAACFNNGTYTIASNGADIYGNADEFHFTYTTLTGDGEIIARVDNITNTGNFALAGLMMRESLDAGSKNATLAFTPTDDLLFQARPNTNGATFFDGVPTGVPGYIRLERQGNFFNSYVSFDDGATWDPLFFSQISMPNTIFVGLAVSAFSTQQVNVAAISDVSINQNSSLLATTPMPQGEQIKHSKEVALKQRRTVAQAFQIEAQKGIAQLSWSTNSEYDNQIFFIERSSNGRDFEQISSIAAAGFSDTVEEYQFNDQSPFVGKNVYRIKYEGQDGVQYSPLLEINIDIPTSKASIFPNPTSGLLTVDVTAYTANTITILVRDSQGRLVHSQSVNRLESHNISLDLSASPNGIYWLSIYPDNQSPITERILLFR